MTKEERVGCLLEILLDDDYWESLATDPRRFEKHLDSFLRVLKRSHEAQYGLPAASDDD